MQKAVSNVEKKPIIAFMYDFDRTLSPKDMQEYAFIPGLGMEASEFWAECTKTTAKHHMDPILSYMYVMLDRSEGKLLVTRDSLRALGTHVKLFKGVSTWFSRINEYAESKGLIPEHYIISSGLKEIIEGTSIAKEFKEIYAASFCYNDRGVPFWPATAVNYTSKTQFLFRINKGLLADGDGDVNEFMPENERRVPFRNMIYIGDGMTDVPCMKLTKVNGGHSIAVYNTKKDDAEEMLRCGRVDYAVKADYSEKSEMEKAAFEIIDLVAAQSKALRRHFDHIKSAQRAKQSQ